MKTKTMATGMGIGMGALLVMLTGGCASSADDDGELVLETSTASLDPGRLLATMRVDGELVSIRAYGESRTVRIAQTLPEGATATSGADTNVTHPFRVLEIQGAGGITYASWNVDTDEEELSGTLGGVPFGDPETADQELDPGVWRPLLDSHVGRVLRSVSRVAEAKANVPELANLHDTLTMMSEIYPRLSTFAGIDPDAAETAAAPASTAGGETVGTTSEALVAGHTKIVGHTGIVECSGAFPIGANCWKGTVDVKEGSGEGCVKIYEGDHHNLGYSSTKHCGFPHDGVQTKDHGSGVPGQRCARSRIWVKGHASKYEWTNRECGINH